MPITSSTLLARNCACLGWQAGGWLLAGSQAANFGVLPIPPPPPTNQAETEAEEGDGRSGARLPKRLWYYLTNQDVWRLFVWCHPNHPQFFLHRYLRIWVC